MLTDLLVKNASSDKLYVEDVFSTWLYTGTGASQTITNGINLSGKGGLVWIKSRTNAEVHQLIDTVRGFGSQLNSALTNAATTEVNRLTGFTSSGFSVESAPVNGNGQNYASWTFRKAPKFFDVVTYTGDGAANRSINHSLGVTPGMIIIKGTSYTGDWAVWHRGDGTTARTDLSINTTSASGWTGNSNPHSATTFNLGSVTTAGGSGMNINGQSYVAYLFAHDTTADGIVQCGSFTKGSGDAEVSLGWEPQFVLVKRFDGTQNWWQFDVLREQSLTNQNGISANTSSAETAFGESGLWPTSSGFKMGGSFGTVGTFIYLAIRRGPMRTPTDATKVFNVLTRTGTGAAATISSGFPVDMIIGRKRTAPAYTGVVDRLRGFAPQLSTQQTVAEVNDTTAITAMGNTTVSVGDDSYNWGGFNQGSQSYAPWMFRRAPGFFDVVCYTGTGSARTVSHNLGVAPELMIFKSRNTNSTNWAVLSQMTSTTYSYGTLQTSNTFSTGKTYGSGGSPNFEELSAAPTASVINIASSAELNASGRTFVAYLFSSCPGVSKVGTYSGTGATQNIDCGFSNGARFVLIRAINDATNWLVFDSARGIVSGNDPVLLLNSTDAEYTSYNAINPYSPGFTLPASNLTNQVNVNYLYLAIA